MDGRWITGEEVLKRWQAAPFELVDAMLSGRLVAVDIKTGAKHAKRDDRCFFCDQTWVDWPVVCYEHPAPKGMKPKGVTAPDTVKVYCASSNPERTAYRMEKARASTFALAEVEAYEQAHGLGPLPHAPESAEALAEMLRAAGITDAGMVARMVKAAFPETTLPKIGVLVTGKPDDKGNRAANTKAAQRALNPK